MNTDQPKLSKKRRQIDGDRLSENVTPKLTLKQKKAIAALLVERTREEAATAVGVKVRTLYRWLETKHFQDALQKAQAAGLADHIRSLQTLLADNRKTMAEVRDNEEIPAHVRLKAVELIERSLLKWRETIEIEERLQLLEAALDPDAD